MLIICFKFQSVSQKEQSHKAEDSDTQVTFLHSRKFTLAQVLHLSKPRKESSNTGAVGENFPFVGRNNAEFA